MSVARIASRTEQEKTRVLLANTSTSKAQEGISRMPLAEGLKPERCLSPVQITFDFVMRTRKFCIRNFIGIQSDLSPCPQKAVVDR